MYRGALLLLFIGAVCLVRGQDDQAERFGLVGKETSKDYINNVLQLKYQVSNNTKRINTLRTHIAENAAETAVLQEISNANGVTIQEQGSLVVNVTNFLIDPIFPLAFLNQQLYSELEDTVLQTSTKVDQIVTGLSNLGRRLRSDSDSGRIISPIAIETAKKCSDELAKLAVAILSNNASLSELQEAFETNEANLAILQSTVEQNEDEIADLTAAISLLREGITTFQTNLLERTENITTIGGLTSLPNIQDVNSLLNVSSIASEVEVPATGGALTAATITASCGIDQALLGGGCSIDLPDEVTLADIAPYITESQGGPVTFASFSFPKTEDYANNKVDCDLLVTSASSTAQTSAYWQDAPFPLVFRAEALCYDDL
eukprot:jgi/Picre1/35633/NNA_003094.t1